jgi:hypothetical protein
MKQLEVNMEEDKSLSEFASHVSYFDPPKLDRQVQGKCYQQLPRIVLQLILQRRPAAIQSSMSMPLISGTGVFAYIFYSIRPLKKSTRWTMMISSS